MKQKPFSTKTFEKYYAEYIIEGIKISEPLNIRQIQAIFLLVLQDYIKGYIDQYALEKAASDLLYGVSNSKEINKSDNELGKALDIASDYSYYYDLKDVDPSIGKRVNEMTGYLKDYFSKNNNLIKKNKVI